MGTSARPAPAVRTVTERWIWVSLPWATFAIVVSGGVVVDAAPIARKSIGRPEREVADYYRSRGARFVPLDAAVSRPQPGGSQPAPAADPAWKPGA